MQKLGESLKPIGDAIFYTERYPVLLPTLDWDIIESNEDIYSHVLEHYSRHTLLEKVVKTFNSGGAVSPA